ncbi:MAG: biopolymer transporter ExbD [Acidobacteriota bacterium]
MQRLADRLTSPHRPDDAIPTSPMADIAFLLVVFFMLTLTFASSRGLDFEVPQEPPPEVARVKVEAVLVRVLPGGGLEVDGEAIPVGDLLATIAPRLRSDPDTPVIVAPRPDAAYGHFVAVYDVLRLARQRLGLDRDVRIVLPESGASLDFS